MAVDDVKLFTKKNEIKLIMDGGTIVWPNIEKSLESGWENKVKVFKLIVTTINSKEKTKEDWEKGLGKFYDNNKVQTIIKEAFDYNKIKSNTGSIKKSIHNITKNV